MKVKLDENLPIGLAAALRSFHHDVHSVRDERMVGCSDEELWKAAQSEARFLITQDLDFSDARFFRPGTHHGILLVRSTAPSQSHLIAQIAEIFEREPVESWSRCFVVATDRKIRVRRP